MINFITKKPIMKDYMQIVVGTILVALSYNMFLLPSKLAAGGISGISTILNEMFGWSPGLTQLVINVPIFLIGWITMGKDFGWKTLLGTVLVPTIIWLTADIPYTITNPFLGTIYGGIVLGLGLGIVYRGGGSTGGTAAIAQVLKKFTGLSSGYAQFAVDGIVVISSIIVFNLELTLFALMCIYVTSKVIDKVQLQTTSSKLVLIITEHEEQVQTMIREQLDRGLTKVRSVGGYSNRNKTMILCVAEQPEAVKLRSLLLAEEPAAFVVFLNASEILGRGFSIDKYYGQKL
ncbi:YitT family protein [Lentibacillus saliphilus]|uniref:YitT family protein n=1 Tax=Lentibacillus saliphilus TaxID=2737028 RepID=UPI001C30D34B|nr:YitT family protein [Lentibacillus saliphilus]